MKGNDEIKNQDRFLIDVDDSQKSHMVIILEIDNIQPSDEGTYKCIAKNNVGESFVLVVLNLAEGKNN